MIKTSKLNLYLSVLLTASVSIDAISSPEVTGKLTHESAAYTSSGTNTGTTISHGKDAFKTETSARIYFDGNIDAADSSYHVEIQGYANPSASPLLDSNEPYTQRESLREAYIDTTLDDWALRLGKQQVVWGTADGMKLLDTINPTDYSEMVQNQMEDSRIPIWMINAETNDDNGGNWQFIASESKANYFSGLGVESDRPKGSGFLDGNSTTFVAHTNNSSGSPFISKGVDTITGARNGFLNIAPALGGVAQAFDRGALTKDLDGNGTNDQDDYMYVSLRGYTKATVNDFAANYKNASASAGSPNTNQSHGFRGFCDNANTTAQCLTNIVNNAMAPNGQNYGGNNQGAQNIMDTTVSQAQWELDKANPKYVIAYMPHATFATFDAFVNMKSKYLVEHENDPVYGLRYKNTTDEGINYSFNFSHGNDTNPYIDMEWQDKSGNLLTETLVSAVGYDAAGNSRYYTNQLRAAGASNSSVGGATSMDGLANTSGSPDGGTAGYVNASYGAQGTATDVAVLVMKEKTNKITQYGGSMDMSIDTDSLGPVVLRAEAVYQKDVMSPVITRKDVTAKDLEHGFLVSSLNMVKGDRFKYVIGADITALTNMMVSFQFIQDRNMDFVDQGGKDELSWKYTGDMATMSLTNNLQKGIKNKEFYSVYLSKPYGESDQHRWNNIFIYEETGGKWNRLDTEYTIDDNTILTAEYNKYWGNENSQFGQFKNSSNVQVGMKYTF